MDTITLPAADDWHHHFRDGLFLSRTVGDASQRFQRVVVMPNLETPIVTVAQALAYRQRIMDQCHERCNFEPLMTLYLTQSMTPDCLREANASGVIVGVKLYPVGVTTHSDQGVSSIEAIYPQLEVMQSEGMVLQIHGEVADPAVDIFDREQRFIDEALMPLLHHFPELKVVLEHITTRYAVSCIEEGPASLAATITPHHLLYQRNQLLSGGLKPHYYCLPVLKREQDRLALLAAAISGSPRFFLGSDSAPHTVSAKQSACGCAGVYSAHAALEIYAEIFESQGAMDRLPDFASRWGAQFYGLPINASSVTLIKKSWTVPETLSFGSEKLIPLKAGQTLNWSIAK